VADLRALADMAAEAWPRVPRLLFGHSLGGLLAVVYLLAHPETVRAAAVTGPAIRVPDAAPRAVQRLVVLLGRVVPRLPLGTKLDERLLARDPAVGAAYVADPLVHRRATAGFFRAVRAAQARALAEAPRQRVPLLILQGDADRIVEPSGASELAARLGCEHELVMLPGYYHELLNEPEAERARVLTLLDRWFDRWLA
jgi:alpha-beta hydrolase superfamily lysophospholipase